MKIRDAFNALYAIASKEEQAQWDAVDEYKILWGKLQAADAELDTALSLSSAYREDLEEIEQIAIGYDSELSTADPEASGLFTMIIAIILKRKALAFDRGAVELTEEEKFIEHLERASKIVAGWPEWKRNLLGKIAVKPEEAVTGIPATEEPVGREVSREELITKLRLMEYTETLEQADIEDIVDAFLKTFRVERR